MMIEYRIIFPSYHNPFSTVDPFLSSQLLLSAIKNIEEQNISILSDNFVVVQESSYMPNPSLCCCGDESPGNISIFVSFDDKKVPVDMDQVIDDVYQNTDSDHFDMKGSDYESEESASMYSVYSVSSASKKSGLSKHSDDFVASSASSIHLRV